jgi:hypothetical protein
LHRSSGSLRIAVAMLVAVAVAPETVRPAGAEAAEGTAARQAASAAPAGYWMYAADGGVFSFGAAGFHGAIANRGTDIAGMATTPSGRGYWMADDDGDVFAAGDAGDFGSRSVDTDDIAVFAARPQGDGYWMATRTGSVEAYGSAPNLGGATVRRSHRMVAMAPTRSGNGYWLGAIDGGVFAFGDAAFLGSMGGTRLNQPIVGMAATPTGNGYWLVASDGGIFAFGDADFFGSTGGVRLNQPIVGMAATPTGNGYWLVASDGGIFAFGDAAFLGSMGAVRLNQPIVGMAAVPAGAVPGPALAPAGGSPIPPVLLPLPPVLPNTPLTDLPLPDVPLPESPLPLPPLPAPDPVPVPAQPVTLVGAGDVAACNSSGDEATARLLDGVVAADPGAKVFTTGDNVYPAGTASEFANCYDPTWGRFKDRTYPAPGNHEYETSGAAGYFDYFGARAGQRGKGYYSYDVGAWHVVVLNSNCSAVGGCGTGSPQEQWLRADLAASAQRCTVAMFHHPRFSSSQYGEDRGMVPFWSALYDHGAELVLNGHAHHYERFAPQRPDGTRDTAFGIREFVVGTGGKTAYPFYTTSPNSEVRNTGTAGVLKLTLRSDGFDWALLPVAGKTFTDSGTGACHGRPAAG